MLSSGVAAFVGSLCLHVYVAVALSPGLGEAVLLAVVCECVLVAMDAAVLGAACARVVAGEGREEHVFEEGVLLWVGSGSRALEAVDGRWVDAFEQDVLHVCVCEREVLVVVEVGGAVGEVSLFIGKCTTSS